jgi:hypothetical protein
MVVAVAVVVMMADSTGEAKYIIPLVTFIYVYTVRTAHLY